MFWPRGGHLVYILTSFPNLSIIFSNFLEHFVQDLEYPILQLQASFNVCAHIPSTLWVSIFYVVFMATNNWNLWCNSWHLCCHCAKCWFPCGMRTITCASFNHIQLLSSTSWHCVYLVDLVIVDPIWVDLFPWSCVT
jgi:hypothetical protein